MLMGIVIIAMLNAVQYYDVFEHLREPISENPSKVKEKMVIFISILLTGGVVLNMIFDKVRRNKM